MSWNLPKLPGYSFQDQIKTRHHVPRKLNYVNGYPIVANDTRGIGGSQMDINGTAYLQSMDENNYDPTLVYGSVTQPSLPIFRPHFVEYDKKLLIFKAYFKEAQMTCPRLVNIIYYLEDDTLTVSEPIVKNSGLWQGKIIKRGKILKDDLLSSWHWKDFNIGINVSIQGLEFHIVSCDDYTKHFLQSQGLEIFDGETKRYEENLSPQPSDKTKGDSYRKSKSRNFLIRSERILQFDAIWEDKNMEYDDVSYYKIYYYLKDNTMTVKEFYKKKSNHEIFPVLLRRTRVPKDLKTQPIDSNILVPENYTDDDDAYYGIEDLLIGRTINILGRLFLLYDCDAETRNFYKSMLNIDQGQRIEPPQPVLKQYQSLSIPPHTGIGDPNDTLMSCLSFHSKPPFKDLIQYNTNTNKQLRYICELISVHPEDSGRKFVLLYRLSDGTICVDELLSKNSGLMGGRFSGPSRINVPGRCTKYYTPDMFYIGAIIIINCHKLRITGCDLYVYQYMKENPGKFPSEVIQNVLEYHLKCGNVKREQIDGASPHNELIDRLSINEANAPDENMQRWEPNILKSPIQGLECAQNLPIPVDENEIIDGNNPHSIVCLTGLSDKPPNDDLQPAKINYDCNCGGGHYPVNQCKSADLSSNRESTKPAIKKVSFQDLPNKNYDNL